VSAKKNKVSSIREKLFQVTASLVINKKGRVTSGGSKMY